jgi:hypothetical protein
MPRLCDMVPFGRGLKLILGEISTFRALDKHPAIENVSRVNLDPLGLGFCCTLKCSGLTLEQFFLLPLKISRDSSPSFYLKNEYVCSRINLVPIKTTTPFSLKKFWCMFFIRLKNTSYLMMMGFSHAPRSGHSIRYLRIHVCAWMTRFEDFGDICS